MAVYEYGPNHRPHAGGFVGLRVAVHCCRAGLLQKYYNFHERDRRVSAREERRMRRQAERLDREWRQRQAREWSQRTHAARTWKHADTPTATGVAGIRMTYTVDRKYRAGQWRYYYAPAFVVHGSHGRQVFTRTVRVQRGTVTAGWGKAVRYYCERKGITGAAVNRLLRRRPPIARFETVRQDLCQRLGYQIPPERVPA